MINIAEIYKQHSDKEFIEFSRVQNKTSTRRDIHAFMLLDKIMGPYVEGTGSNDIISCAEHDEIWLATDVGELAKVATEDQIIELMRCGVRYDDNNESLCMFV